MVGIGKLAHLPLELRQNIYSHLLSVEHTKALSSEIACEAENPKPENPKLWPKYAYDLHPAILCTNKQIYSEARDLLYDKQLFVEVHSNDQDLKQICANVGLTMMLIREKNFGWCAICIKHKILYSTYPAEGKNECFSSYRMAAADTATFCEALLLANTRPHWRQLRRTTLDIRVVDKDGGANAGKVLVFKPPLAKILCSFTILQGLMGFDINGAVSTDLRLNVKEQFSRAPAPVENLLDDILITQEQGRSYYQKGEWTCAVPKFQAALRKFLCHFGNFQGNDIVQTGRHAGKTNAMAFEELHFRLKHILMLSHLRLHEWENAYFWASLITDVNPTELRTTVWQPPCSRLWALILFEKAYVSRKIGNEKQEEVDFNEAIDFGYSIGMQETAQLGAAMLSEDEGELIDGFEAALRALNI